MRAPKPSRVREAWATTRRAYSEFLTLPSLVIAGFLVGAIALYAVERATPAWLQPTHDFLRRHFFADARSTSDFLSAIATGLITVTSITISLLLLALQQTAASMTSAVFDQFLRRRYNQFYFGFFVGLALFALVTLATVNQPFNPVLAAAIACLLTIVALLLLIVLLYTAVNQMRPTQIVESVHNHAIVARTHERELLRRTRRRPSGTARVHVPVHARTHGYVTRVDVDAMAHATRPGCEVVLHVSLGSFVATGDLIAEIGAGRREEAEPAVDPVRGAVRIERRRDIAVDPGSGIADLTTIGWTSISSAQSNPASGLEAVRSLRDLLAVWGDEMRAEEEKAEAGDDHGAAAAETLPVVYPDTVIRDLFGAFETLAVASSESMQHQVFAEIATTFAVLLPRIPSALQEQTVTAIRRVLPALGDHVLTSALDASLGALTAALMAVGRRGVADEVERARLHLAATIGTLASRQSRAG